MELCDVLPMRRHGRELIFVTLFIPFFLMSFGHRNVFAQAGVAEGLEQERGGIAVQPGRYPEYVNRWAIIVGISDYKDDRLDLDYADNDAEALYELLLTASGGGFDEDHIVKLTNEEATKDRVERALRSFLKKPAPEDIVFLFFAAHGTPDPDRPGNVYLLTHDTDLDDISGTAMPMREIRASIADNLHAERVVLLADTCHSGSIGTASGVRGGDNATAVNRYLQELSTSRAGVALMTSAESGEVAREDQKWGGGHGVFTHYLLEGMRGKADLPPEDGKVTVGELFEFVRDNVKDATNDQQHPSIGQSPFDRNLPVAITGGVTAQELYRLGLGLYELGRLEDDPGILRSAENELREAIRLARRNNQSFPEAQLNRGRALLALDDADGAMAVFKNAAKLDGDLAAEAKYYLGFSYAKIGEVKKAKATLQDFLEESEDDPRSAWIRSFVAEMDDQRAPKRYALLVGIDDYKDDSWGDLRGPVNDVALMEEVLTGRYGFNVRVLTNGNASREAILGVLSDLSREASRNDVVYFHFSGHATNEYQQARWEGAYLIPQDFQTDSPSTTAISAQELHSSLLSIPARNKTVVLDTHPSPEFFGLAGSAEDYEVIAAATPGTTAKEIFVQERAFGALSYQLAHILQSQVSDRTTYQELEVALVNELATDEEQTPIVVGKKSRPFLGGEATESSFILAFDLALRRNWETTSSQLLKVFDDRLHSASKSLFPELYFSMARAFLDHSDFESAKKFALRTVDDPGWVGMESLLVLAAAQAGLGELRSIRDSVARASSIVSSADLEGNAFDRLSLLAERPTRAALLVGIDEYQNPRIGNLNGATNDLSAMRRLLVENFGFEDNEIVTLLNGEGSRQSIIDEFRNLISSDPMVGVFYYSGKGSANPGGLGRGGQDSLERAIVPADGRLPEVDDIGLRELVEIVGDTNANIVSIFDCDWGQNSSRGLHWNFDPSGLRGIVAPPPPDPNAYLPTLGTVSLFAFVDTGELTETRKPDPWERERTRTYGNLAYGLVEAVLSDPTQPLAYRDVSEFFKDHPLLKSEVYVAGQSDQFFLGATPFFTRELWFKFQTMLPEHRRIQEAIIVLERKLEQRKGEYPDGWLNVGVAYAAIGEYKKSVAALEKAIVQGGGNTQRRARYHLGRVLNFTGEDFERAVSELREVLKLDPANTKARYFLAESIRALVEQDLLTEAEDELRQYLSYGAPLGRVEEVKAFLDSRNATFAR